MEVDAEKLIFLIEARSSIYNYKDKEHANKITIDKLWIEIANEMNCPVSECKNKWTILRNSYSRYLREDKSKPSGSSGKQKKKWYLADSMSFLKDYVHQHRTSGSNLDTPVLQETLDEILVEESTASESLQSEQSTSRISPVPSKRSRTSTSEMIAGPMIEFLKSKTREKTPENANALFFKSLLVDYEQLSTMRQRSFRLAMLTKMNELQEEGENEASTTNMTFEDWQD